MFNTALHAEMLADMKDFGFDVTNNGFDWGLVVFIIAALYILCLGFDLSSVNAASFINRHSTEASLNLRRLMKSKFCYSMNKDLWLLSLQNT